MFLHTKLETRTDPIRIAFIGCGKFVSMFLAQYNHLNKIQIDSIVDININQAKKNCLNSGLRSETIEQINFSKSLDEIAKLAMDREKFLKSIPAIQPVNNDDLTRIASGFGYRIDPFTKAKKHHYGIDFTAPQGTPVYATGDGTVIRADNRSSGYGNHIRINHGYGYTSLYAHLYKFNVKRYQKVKRGDLIGYVGSTGRSSAPHLHYEIFKDKVKINPINFYYGNLTAKEYDELLKQASVVNQSLD